MSHNKLVDLNYFKFSGINADTYTVVHGLGDLRPLVEIYNDEGTNLRINNAGIEVIDANTIEITLGAVIDIRGTVVGAPEPAE